MCTKHEGKTQYFVQFFRMLSEFSSSFKKNAVTKHPFCFRYDSWYKYLFLDKSKNFILL